MKSWRCVVCILLISTSFLSNIALQAQTVLEIWEIQGDGFSSPFEDSIVTTVENIVTYVTDDRFFIQTPNNRIDQDTLTSNGIMVYVGSEPVLSIGDVVTVTGEIQEYFDLTEFGPDNLQYEVISSGADLPTSVQIDSSIASTVFQVLPNLERLEGMRISFSNAIATGPINDELLPVSFHEQRPFREPGIEAPGMLGLPVWDGNPEVLQINFRWSPNTNYSTGATATGLGVLTYSNGQYQIIPEEVEVESDPVINAVRDKESLEVTVGSLNCFVFSNTSSDFSARVFKVAKYIIEQLKSPDILAVQEVRDLATLEALALEIEEQAPGTSYTPYLELGNQGGSFQINNGFLVKNTVQNISISQWGADEVLSLGGLLHDRPPLLLQGEFATNPATPIQVLNLHLRSLGGIEGNSSNFVRTKRWEQSTSVANIIRDLYSNNLIIVGDFNAFQFSDGYVDVLAQLTGTPSLGAEFPVLDIIETPLINHSALISTPEQYSFIFRGNAQILDHCLSNELEGLNVNELQYARGNSDNPDSDVNNTFVPYRASDHDGFVLYLGLNDSISVSNDIVESTQIKLLFQNPYPQNGAVEVLVEKPGDYELSLYNALGQLVFYKKLNANTAKHFRFQPNLNLQSGLYHWVLKHDKAQIHRSLLSQ